MKYDYLTNEQYAKVKRLENQKKKLKEQVRNNQKSFRGFGYEYKPIQFDYPSNDE